MASEPCRSENEDGPCRSENEDGPRHVDRHGGHWRDDVERFLTDQERARRLGDDPGEVARLQALLAERAAEIARHLALLDEMRQTWDTLDDIDVFIDPERAGEWHAARNRMDYLVSDHRAALAARGVEVQG